MASWCSYRCRHKWTQKNPHDSGPARCDGFHPVNVVSSLRSGPDCACTPAGIMEILNEAIFAIASQEAVVVAAAILWVSPLPCCDQLPIHGDHFHSKLVIFLGFAGEATF